MQLTDENAGANDVLETGMPANSWHNVLLLVTVVLPLTTNCMSTIFSQPSTTFVHYFYRLDSRNRRWTDQEAQSCN